MIDFKKLKENFEEVSEKLLTRCTSQTALDAMKKNLSSVIELDKNRRACIVKTEELQQLRNQLSKEIGMLKKENKNCDELQAKVQKIKEELEVSDAELSSYDTQLTDLLQRLPNIPDDSVPRGKSETDNLEIRRWGTPKTFDFTLKQHFEIGENLNILDLERSAKLSGARFSLLRGSGALLERALSQFMLDLQTKENGYTEFSTPYMVNTKSMYGSGQLPKFEEDLFKVNGEIPLYLIPTSEVPLVNIHAEETLDESSLPKLYTALTPCFRSEAGSYGKDTRGIIRVHQFNKVEMVNLTTPETSYDALEKLINNAEKILQLLEIPYRVVVLCTADMGFASSKTYDLEVWLPGQNMYREISSCSNCTDFQARRANIKYKSNTAKPQFLHTLNGSGIAVGRAWIAVLENYQQADGSVVVPKILRPYMNGLEIITKEI